MPSIRSPKMPESPIVARTLLPRHARGRRGGGGGGGWRAVVRHGACGHTKGRKAGRENAVENAVENASAGTEMEDETGA